MIRQPIILFPAIRRLFEMRILGCAFGDLKQSHGAFMFFKGQKPNNSSDYWDINCSCFKADLPGKICHVKLVTSFLYEKSFDIL